MRRINRKTGRRSIHTPTNRPTHSPLAFPIPQPTSFLNTGGGGPSSYAGPYGNQRCGAGAGSSNSGSSDAAAAAPPLLLTPVTSTKRLVLWENYLFGWQARLHDLGACVRACVRWNGWVWVDVVVCRGLNSAPFFLNQ